MKKNIAIISILFYAFINFSCNKYLDPKPNQKFVVPSTLSDLQAILDNYTVINNNDPSSGEVSADNYYLNAADYNALAQDNYRRMYTWQKDYVFANDNNNDWFYSYRAVYASNTVLEAIDKASLTGSVTDVNSIKGQALFIRAKSYFQLAVIFSPAFNSTTANKDFGIPLRMTSDFNVQIPRSTEEQAFNQIILDLKRAVALLPVTQVSVYRATKPASYGLLSRVFLYVHDFANAKLYADSCLQLTSGLLDYNKLSTSATYPITKRNIEVLFESLIPPPPTIANTKAKIDSNLFKSYDANDLRKVLFFKNNNNGTYAFKGSYEAGSTLFSGVATDEIYLTRAECYARLNKVAESLSDLNTLLIKRWKSGTFVSKIANDQSQALSLILGERRKELLMRGLRFMDIKRLNIEGAGITISRNINGQAYTLMPNDLRFAVALPENLVSVAGLQQNLR